MIRGDTEWSYTGEGCVWLYSRAEGLLMWQMMVSSADCKHRTTLRLCKSWVQRPLNNIVRRSMGEVGMSGSWGRGKWKVVVLLDVEQGIECRMVKRVKEKWKIISSFFHEFSRECNLERLCSFPKQEVHDCFCLCGSNSVHVCLYASGHMPNIEYNLKCW